MVGFLLILLGCGVASVFASAVLKTFRHEMHGASKVYYPEYLSDFGKQVVDEVSARYENDGRSYAPTGKNEFTLLPNPYDEEEAQ